MGSGGGGREEVGVKKKGEEMKKSGRGSKGIEGRRVVCSERDRLVYDGERGKRRNSTFFCQALSLTDDIKN